MSSSRHEYTLVLVIDNELFKPYFDGTVFVDRAGESNWSDSVLCRKQEKITRFHDIATPLVTNFNRNYTEEKITKYCNLADYIKELFD